MPISAADHRKRASYDENFLNFLGGAKSKWPAWAMVAAFYSALHHVQAFLLDRNLNPEGHFDRNDLLKSWPSLRSPYMRLYQWSRDARYNCHSPNEQLLGHAVVSLDLVKTEVAKLP